MGTTMEAVQNAYRGFSRGNFTMLDNLALGFAGTKEGMQELLDKAEQISGIKYDISSYSDIVQAIHVVQTEMGITGTTAKEAAETLQGSAGSMKAAWENLVTGLARPDADLGQLIANFTESAETSINNMIPIIEQALNGISKLVEELAPKIASGIPAFVKRVGPPLISAAMQLVKAFGNAVLNGAPQLLPYITETIKKVIALITENSGEAMASFIEVIGAINSLIMEHLPEFIQTGGQMILAIAQGIIDNLPTLIGYITEMVSFLADQISENLPIILDTTISLISAIGNGIKDNLPMLINAALTLVESLADYLKDALPELIPAAIDMILQIVKTITEPDNILRLVDAAIAILLGLVDGLLNSLDVMAEDLPKIVDNIVDALIVAAPKLLDAAIEIIAKLAEYLLNPENTVKLLAAAFKIVVKLAEGIVALQDKMRSAANDLIEAFFDEIGLGDAYRKGKEFIEDFKDGMNDAIESGGFGGALASGAKGAWNSLKTAVNPVGGIVSGFKSLTGHATGGIMVDNPVLTTSGDLFGEDGREVILPLDSNTGWMDELAKRLGGSSGVVVQNLNINMDGMKIASDYDTERFVEMLSERLQALSTSQTRQVGGAGW